MSRSSRDGPAGASVAEAPADGLANARTAVSRLVDGEVLEVLDDYGLAHVRAQDGATYGLNRETPGVSFTDLREGQRVRLAVAPKFNRVLQAHLLV